MKHHNLKSFTKQFQHIINGDLHSRICPNDRPYEIGDVVTLHEGQPGLEGFEYTGRSVSARISYIDDFGCQHGYVNLSFTDVGLLYADSLETKV